MVVGMHITVEQLVSELVPNLPPPSVQPAQQEFGIPLLPVDPQGFGNVHLTDHAVDLSQLDADLSWDSDFLTYFLEKAGRG